MKIAFTVCSNNYLSQAKILGDSLLKFNPDYKFVVGLCDKMRNDIDYSPFSQFDVIEVANIGVDNFEWMVNNYKIVELNTAIKPSFFLYFIKNYSNLESVIYFDPDIQIFNKLSSIEEELKSNSTILTPHILSPIDLDNKRPTENIFLNYGIYNLGFLAIRPDKNSIKLLEWWRDRLRTGCLEELSQGFFVDQLPMTFAPLFFDNVGISSNKGYNVAYWNFQEREISLIDDTYYINGTVPLTFFHFSSFKPKYPLTLSVSQNRFELKEDSDLYHLFQQYAEKLIENKYFELINIPCYYTEIRTKYLETKECERLAYEKTMSNRRKLRILRDIVKAIITPFYHVFNYLYKRL